MDAKEAILKMEFLKSAYQQLIDECVGEGRVVGPDTAGTWEADTPLTTVYKKMVEACDMAIRAIDFMTYYSYPDMPPMGGFHDW